MNLKNPKKNVWASDFNQTTSNPFGFFKSLFNQDQKENVEEIEIFPETATIFKENNILSLNSEINSRIYADKRFELIDKYKDFILEKDLQTKLKTIEIANKLIEKGLGLMKNLENLNSLKNFDNRSNYILISYEIRKVFLELLECLMFYQPKTLLY